MSDVLEYLNLSAIGMAGLCLMLVLMFIHPPRGHWRMVGVALAAVAIASPFIHLRTTMGQADPWVKEGRYQLVGWKSAEDEGKIFLMVDDPAAGAPRHYEVPFNLDLALQLQEIRADPNDKIILCVQFDPEEKYGPPVEVRRILARVMDMIIDCEDVWAPPGSAQQ